MKLEHKKYKEGKRNCVSCSSEIGSGDEAFISYISKEYIVYCYDCGITLGCFSFAKVKAPERVTHAINHRRNQKLRYV